MAQFSTIPDKVGRYEVIRPIGKGGFAMVYLCRDPYINRSLALKVIMKGESKESHETLSRLFKEAEAAGALSHPGIVTIYDAGIFEPFCYIAMEYIEGRTLHQNCSPENLLPIAEAIDIIIKVCHALDYAHQRDIIHRDIKPSNILIGRSGEIKIADFGLACFSELASHDKRSVGTPSYMPPEQILGKGATAQSDIFSVGVILYQLLCGKKPFEAQSPLEVRHKIVSEPHVPLLERDPSLPPVLASITDRALSKKAKERYRNGFDLARDLEAVMHESGPMDSKFAQRIKDLQTLKFFEGFSYDEIAGLMDIGTWLTHKQGDTIIHEDDTGGAFYVIAKGQAKVSVGGADMGELARGDCFGEMSFILHRRRSATVTATDECHLLRLNPEKIDILDDKAQVKLYRLFARSIAMYLLKAEGKQ